MPAVLPWEAEEYKILKAMVHKFGEQEVKPMVSWMEKEEKIPSTLWEKMIGLGFFGIPFDESFGGAGLGKMGFCVLIEELAYYHAALSLVVIAHTSLASEAIYLFGTDQQKQKYVKPFGIFGDKIGAFAVTEPGAGSDVAAMETKASNIRGGVVLNGYMLNGSKQFITNADVAQFAVVWAQTIPWGSKTLAAFIVDLPTPGLKISKREKKMGLHASHTNSFTMEEVFVPEVNVLGRIGEGFKMAMEVFNRSRLGIAASCLGFIRRAIDETIRYTSQRKMFGGTLLDMQNTQMELAKMEAARYLLESAIYRAAWQADQGQYIRKDAAIVKYMASDLAVKVVDKAVQLHGGSGYMQDYFIEQLYRDVRAYPLFEGANEVQLLTIAKNLLNANKTSTST